jgi:alpha-galactosidase
MRNYLFLIIIICWKVILSGQTDYKMTFETAKFNPGNDIFWIQKDFDDRDWNKISTDKIWEDQGYKDLDGFAWYRIHFKLDPQWKKVNLSLDSLSFFLSKIDDVAEIFLNGKKIAKFGSFPTDQEGYITEWNIEHQITMNLNDNILNWDTDNVIAIKVFDGDGAGGMFGKCPYVKLLFAPDRCKINFENISAKVADVILKNENSKSVEGIIKITCIDPYDSKNIFNKNLNVKIEPNSTFSQHMDIKNKDQILIKCEFLEKSSKKTIFSELVLPYLLTPPPSDKVKINGPAIFGVRPGSPFLYKIPATGKKPLYYLVENMPSGLMLDTKTGVITGNLLKRGDYNVRFVVSNEMGTEKKDFVIRCGDLLALTPPMGWNSWNCWGLSVSDEKVRSSAKAMIDKGLIDHGWNYINIDDGWELVHEGWDGNYGKMLTNNKFPDMNKLSGYLHSQGLKLGIYSSPGHKTCGGYEGSFGYEEADAATFSDWGIDYLKYDWCSYGLIHDKTDTSAYSYKKPYIKMSDALRKQKRDIVYSLCQYGMKDVWKWGGEVGGNLWRTTGDIMDTWNSLKEIGFNQGEMAPYSGLGRWNDPDMLIVGKVGWGEKLHTTQLTPDEQYTHISLWCLLSAPLLIGCDMNVLDDFTLSLLSNDEVLAIDQDPLGKSATCIYKTDEIQIWLKELSDGSKAFGIFNMTDKITDQSISLKLIGFDQKPKLRDLWRQKDLGTIETLKLKLMPHGVLLVKEIK